MPPELQNIELCEPVHSLDNDSLQFKFETEHPEQEFQTELFQALSAEMKTSRLMFDCEDDYINKYVHRTMWGTSNRGMINNIVMTDNHGIQAVVAYHIAKYCTGETKAALGMSGNEKVIILNFFGVNKPYKKKQMGFLLLNQLIDECIELAEHNPDYKYLILEAFSDEACKYYERFGFKEFNVASNGGTMYALALS